MLLEHHLDELYTLARKVCWLFQRIAKTGGGLPVSCCIPAAKLPKAHTGGAVRCKVPPEQHMIRWPVFFPVADFLNINSWLLLHSESQKKNPGSYSEVTVRSGFSPAILFYMETISWHPGERADLLPPSPLGSPSPPVPTALLFQINNIWIWRSGPCNFLFFFLILSTFAQLLELTDSLGRGRTNADQTWTCTHCDPSSPAQLWGWTWEKVQLWWWDMMSMEARGWDPAVTFPRIH